MSEKKNFLPEKMNSSKGNYTIGGTGCSSHSEGAAPGNYTTKAANAMAAFVDLKAKYKYLILLQGS